MKHRKIVCATFVAFAALVLAVSPLLAGDDSNLAARATSWQEQYNAGNLEAVAELYAEDGCRMPPNEKIVNGRAAVHAQLRAGVEQGMARVKIAVTGARSSGTLAYGTGTYEILSADGAHLDHGKWMNASTKVAGQWKIQCDIWNSDMPAPAPTQ